MWNRLRATMCACLVVLALGGCAGLKSRLGFSAPQHSVDLTTPMTYAASGTYLGHNWVRYAAIPAGGGICYALEIDGQDAANAGGTRPVKANPTGANAYIPSCGLVPGEKVVPIQPLLDQRTATATDFGYLSGI